MPEGASIVCSCHDSPLPAEPVDAATVARLATVPVATAVQCLQRMGFDRSFLAGVVPRVSAQRFAGTAFTARLLPVREDIKPLISGTPSLHRRSFESVEAGQVLVFDARGDVSTGVLGDILAARLKARGAAAFVTDGAIRDLPAMEEVGLPMFSRGVHAGTFGREHYAADLNVPVQCAGALIMPGDVLIGDAEGVCVVPQAVASQLAEEAVEQELLDTFLRGKVEAGAPLEGTFPPGAEVRDEYDRWRADPANGHQRA